MKTAVNVIKEIAEVGSTLAKQAILQANSDNPVVRNCFLYAESPRYQYYVRVKSDDLPAPGKRHLDMRDFDRLDELRLRVVTGNAARDHVSKIMECLLPEDQILLMNIINKDLRCNCGTAIANKVWKNLIPEYPVLLCGKMDEKAQKHLSQFEGDVGFYVELKEDGGRLLTTVDYDGTVTYKSRNGNVLNLHNVFDAELSKFPGMVFDGELVVQTESGKPDRKTGNGFYTKAVRGTLEAKDANRFSYQLWDAVPIVEYDAGKGTQTYGERSEFIEKITAQCGNISQVYGKYVKTLDECMEFYAQMRKDGQEGAIIKVANSVWEDGRSKNYIKLKAINDCDALCIGVEEGKGRLKGKIGKLICQDSTGQLSFRVGTGLKDEDRDRDPSYYVGNIIECVYNEVITSKGRDTKSLFLPVYKCVRFDKNQANSLAELK